MDILVAGTIAAVFLWLAVKSLPYLYSYEIKNNEVRIVVFGIFRFLRFPIKNIKSIEKKPWKEISLLGFGLRFGNRPFSDGVVIQSESGFIKEIIITPKDPDEFVRAVKLIKTTSISGKNHSIKQ